MRTYKLTHLVDAVLLRNLATLVRRDRTNTATLLAYIAEVDERRLYLPAGHPSMFAYCLAELHLSEDAAYKRIRAARTARAYPALFPAVADGRLHLTAILLLAPYLNPANGEELIAAATHKGRADLEVWIARRFPRPEVLRLDDGISALPQTRLVPMSVGAGGKFAPEPDGAGGELAPGPVGAGGELVPKTVSPLAELAPEPAPTPRTRLAPQSSGRFALQVTIEQATHDKLRYAQALLGHALPSGDVALVLDRALDSLIVQLEKRKFAATRRPRRQPRPTHSRRHIPAHVRRAVWERDGGQCTFTSEEGRRCGARTRLEFDHIDPVARGGRATRDRMRLRCRAHNQLEAERAFGAEIMRARRTATRRDANSAGTWPHRIRNERPHGDSHPDEQALDVIAGLRALGMPAADARRLATASRPDRPVTLEERLRLALRAHRPRRIVQAEGRPGVPGVPGVPGGTGLGPQYAAAGP